MQKTTVSMFLFVLLTLTLTQLAVAQWQDNIVTNQTAENIYIVESTLRGRNSSGSIPAGHRTTGFHRIQPDEQRAFRAWANNPIYFQIWKGGRAIKPLSSTQTVSAWVHPNQGFTVVTESAISTPVSAAQIRYTSRSRNELEQRDGFIRYANGARISVTSAWVPVVVEPVVVEPVVAETPPPPAAGGTQIMITAFRQDGSKLQTSELNSGADIDLVIKVTHNGNVFPNNIVTLSTEGLSTKPKLAAKDILGPDGSVLTKGREGETLKVVTDEEGKVEAAMRLDLVATGQLKFIAKATGVPGEAAVTEELSYNVVPGAGARAHSVRITPGSIVKQGVVEPKGGNFSSGKIPLTFTLTSEAGNPLPGATFLVKVSRSSGSVAAEFEFPGQGVKDDKTEISLDSNRDGKASATLLLTNGSSGKLNVVVRIAKLVDGRATIADLGSLPITVAQTPSSFSVSVEKTTITSGETARVTATLRSRNGTPMSGEYVKFYEHNSHNLEFTSPNKKTNSSGEASSTLLTGNKNSGATITVSADGVSPKSYTIIVVPDIRTTTEYFSDEGKRIGAFTKNYYQYRKKRVRFPGRVVSATWRSESSNAVVTKKELRVLYTTEVTIRYKILAKTWPLAWIRVWVTADYEWLAPYPSAPALQPQLRPETDPLSAVWQDLSQVPSESALLPNYPNPFNPETWLPYHLAEPAEVTLSIYSAGGQLVRTLALGHQPAGIYASKSRAAYWDGRNAVGERVASGVYFYTLTAGDFAATEKMLIMK